MEQEEGITSSKKWFPLESNPEVMNAYAERLGMDLSLFSFQDVLSTEDWALSMIPRPVLGVLLLFPISEASEEHRRLEAEREQLADPKLYYMKQVVGNACGTIGILHAVMNSLHRGMVLRAGSFLERMFLETAALSADEKADWLGRDDELDEAQEIATSEGQSAQIGHDEPVNSHFICFTSVEGTLYELDGRKKSAINHGPCVEVDLLEKACTIIKQFMERDPEEVRFTVVALAANPVDQD